MRQPGAVYRAAGLSGCDILEQKRTRGETEEIQLVCIYNAASILADWMGQMHHSNVQV